MIAEIIYVHDEARDENLTTPVDSADLLTSLAQKISRHELNREEELVLMSGKQLLSGEITHDELMELVKSPVQ